MIITSAATPVLIAVDWGFPEYPILRWFPLITAVLAAIFASALKTFKLQENWVNYRSICESLKKEYHYYKAGVGEYQTTPDKESLFVKRVEQLISRSHTSWMVTQDPVRTEHT